VANTQDQSYHVKVRVYRAEHQMVRYGMVSTWIDARAAAVHARLQGGLKTALLKGIFWMYVFRLEEGEYPNVRFVHASALYALRQCPCVKVCPVGGSHICARMAWLPTDLTLYRLPLLRGGCLMESISSTGRTGWITIIWTWHDKGFCRSTVGRASHTKIPT